MRKIRNLWHGRDFLSSLQIVTSRILTLFKLSGSARGMKNCSEINYTPVGIHNVDHGEIVDFSIENKKG